MPKNIRFRTPYENEQSGPTRIVQTISAGDYVTREFPLSEASRIGRFRNVERQFLRTGDDRLLDEFSGQGVTDIEANFLPFETDPNMLYELHEMDAPQFHEVYEDPQDGGR